MVEYEMELHTPEARGHSQERIINFIGQYGKEIIDHYEFDDGNDVYVADELFAKTGYNKDGAPFFMFHSEDREESDYFSKQQKMLRSQVIDHERKWIVENITLAAFVQMKQIFTNLDKAKMTTSFDDIPRQALREGFITRFHPALLQRGDSNIIDFVPHYSLTWESSSFMYWYYKEIKDATIRNT